MKTFPMRARFRNEGNGPARVDIFDDIGSDFWGGGISAQDFAAQMAAVKGPLDVHINSYGGDVFAGQTMAEAIRNHPGPVTTKVDGIAASIASVIAQAGKVREAAPGALIFLHDAWSFAEGNAADMRAEAETLDKVSNVLAGEYARAAGGTAEQWRGVMQAEKWYDAQEALDAGLIDRISGGAASLPQGMDVEQLAARAPGRIMAALRSMPVAAAPGTETPVCRTCDGRGTVPHPATGQKTLQCPGCQGTGLYDPDDPGETDEPEGEPDSGMQDRLRAQAGKPYEPQPYKRTSDENTQCPACQKFSDDDARYCGQCGTQLAGRTDVKEAELPPASNSLDAAALDALRPVFDQWFSAEIARLRNADPKVDESDWDGPAAMSAAAKADDPAAALSAICAGRKAGPADQEGSYALPYKKTPSSPPNADGTRNALARLPQTEGLTNEAEARETLQAAMKQVNPDWEPEDSTETSIFSRRLREMQGAMPSLKGAGE